MTDTPTNTFTDGPRGTIYLKTALPIIFVMGMNGLLSVADALPNEGRVGFMATMSLLVLIANIGLTPFLSPFWTLASLGQLTAQRLHKRSRLRPSSRSVCLAKRRCDPQPSCLIPCAERCC
jgi:hypothetical protein